MAVEVRELGADRQQRHVRVPETEGRQALQFLAQLEGQLAPSHDRVDRRHGTEILEAKCARRMVGEGLGEGLDVLGRDREPGRSSMAAPTAKQVRAGGESAVEVEGGDGAARADPVLARLPACDQHDRPAEPLDEPGRDDPDDPSMPVLSGDHVAKAPPQRLRPLLDLPNRVPQDAILDRLAVAVQRFELAGQPPGLRPRPS